ncbi:MAG: flagellar hook protein FlgE [Terriglobales bacterium]|jgi:flagellar hook protein FlgE
MSSFSIALSGLSASSDALNIISNDLANLNTVGFKDQEASFSDLFYQNLGTNGSGDPIEEGLGTQIGAVSTNFAVGGTVQQTGVPSNVAITGNGFFITQNANGNLSYTRAGNFGVNTQGELVTDSGATVLGYPAENGVVNTGGGLGGLYVGSNLVSPPNATTTMQMQTNLDANSGTGGTFSTPMTVYDSLGNSHVLSVNYTQTGTGAWSYQVTVPAADTGGTGNPTVVASGTMTFDGNGNLTSPTGSIAISVPNLADGAKTMNISWNLTSASGTPLITQLASASATSAVGENGYANGTLQSYLVGPDGTIEGTFSNGQTQALGQIALANFANDQGLESSGNNSYTPTLASGAAVVGVPNAGGLGTLTGGALEMSNVDISTEFTNLIVIQRGFEANARMITTLDSIESTTTNLQAEPGN